MQNRVPTTLYGTRFRLSLLLVGLICLLSGCGIGNSFTGGGVPIGKAVIKGQVVSATMPNSPIPNANVIVSVSTNTRVGETLNATADSQGRFNFPNIPVDTAPTSIRVAVIPPSGDFVPQQVFFKLDKDKTANLIMSLVPPTVDVSSAANVALSSDGTLFSTSLTGKINAQVLDSQGNPLKVSPSLLFIGDFHSVQADGSFTSNSEGVGTVQAFWYNNLQTSSTLSIQSDGVTSPPPPPATSSGKATRKP